MNFESWLAAKNIDAETLSPSARIALEAAWRAEQNPAPAPTPAPTSSLDKVVADAEANIVRKSMVSSAVAEYITKDEDRVAVYKAIGEQAIAGGWDKDKTELHLGRAYMASHSVNFYTPSKPQVSDDVIEAAMCRTAGLSRESVEKSYSDQTLSAADKQFKGGVGIQQLLKMSARSNGYRDVDGGDWGRILRASFAAQMGYGNNYGMTAGPSTIDVSTILSNVANKFSVDAFNAVESVWRRIAATRPVNDFKQITGVALTGNLVYKEIGSGGAFKHGTVGEETYSNQAKLYGIMIGLDYKQIRNDDLGEFAKLNRKMGRGGALTINEKFWKKFLDNANFFSTGNGNYRANADVAMTLAGLGKANQLWNERTDPDGHPMGDKAKFLLVPTNYELDAKQFMTSTRISNDGGDGENNVLAGKWDVETSTYLTNVAMQPGADSAARTAAAAISALTYYLLADQNDLPVIEMVFLDGKEIPTIESAEADFHHLGIELRAHHAFGAELQEHRGGYRFKTTS